MDRKFYGIELKKSYFNYACQNLDLAKRLPKQYNKDLFKIDKAIMSYNNEDLSQFITSDESSEQESEDLVGVR